MSLICGAISNRGLHGEPLACAHAWGHPGDHAWASLAVYRQPPSRSAPTFQAGELAINFWDRTVRLGDGATKHLTKRELSLLHLLASNAGRTLTRDEILDRLWGEDEFPGSNLIDVLVSCLRAKLQDRARRPRFIATVPGQGYQFVAA